jgi:RNA polymerase sigma-70 factor, ECF subfamily
MTAATATRAVHTRARPPLESRAADARPEPTPRLLDPEVLSSHIDRLYRAAWALCGSPQDAEDLVQETFARVLKRPRVLRNDDDLGYLLRALRNTYFSRHRDAARRPRTVPLADEHPGIAVQNDASKILDAHEVMAAIAGAPGPFRDAVIAVDLLGLSYREAARHLHSREATIATRVFRGRQHVARALAHLADT